MEEKMAITLILILEATLLIGATTGTLQKVFKLVCLTPGHLAFQFDEMSKDIPPRTVTMEYRFLVDYTWENILVGY